MTFLRLFHRAATSAALAASLSLTPAIADAADLVLTVQPILSETQTRAAFQPLADYLTKATGRTIVIRTRPNFMAYWDDVRRGAGVDLVLDAAHFTDYRLKKHGYQVVAKIPDTVSYTLIVSDQNPIIDPAELIAKRVATLGVPSIGAARLNALFPNAARQPKIVEVDSAEEGMKLLLEGKVQAAILPTPIVSQQMAQGGGITVVLTTEPIPHIALSVAPSIDSATRERVRAALVGADKTPEGRAMLQAIGFPRFDPATANVYNGQAKILQDYWGY